MTTDLIDRIHLLLQTTDDLNHDLHITDITPVGTTHNPEGYEEFTFEINNGEDIEMICIAYSADDDLYFLYSEEDEDDTDLAFRTPLELLELLHHFYGV